MAIREVLWSQFVNAQTIVCLAFAKSQADETCQSISKEIAAAGSETSF